VILDAGNVAAYLVARGLVAAGDGLTIAELGGGVSGTVLAVHGPGVALVVKQALPRLKVADEWLAPTRRTDTEAAALRLAAGIVPGSVPAVVDSDPHEHVLVLEHAPPEWRNWQDELLAGRAHAGAAVWAGETLGRLHAATAGDRAIATAFGDYEAFRQLRLEPYYATAGERLPHLAGALEPLVEQLRSARICLVHGDYAPKNMLLGRDGAWLLDAEVAHVGDPVFDLAFFLAFPLLTTLQKPELARECARLVAGFLAAYGRCAGALQPAPRSVVAHTGAMLLARTDGRSPAAFLAPAAVLRARELGTRLLLDPTADLAEVVASCA